MRKFFHIFLLFLLLLPSCKQVQPFTEEQAEESTTRLIEALQSRDMNRVWDVVKESQGAIFYVFDNNQLIFWSDNALASREVPSRDYSRKWYDYHFDNADARIMWTRYGSLEVMTVLPIEWDIHSAEVLEQSFSYLPLQQQGAQPWLQAARVRVRVYYILLVAIGAILLLLVIGTLWKNRGLGNIKLANKIQVLLTLLLVLSFSYVIFSVVRFERIRYKEKQAQRLQEKCEYVRSALQNLYYWDFFLSEDNTAGLNVDLRDLAYIYGADIHVFDMNGRVVGSSTPQLFQNGLLNHRMAPEVFFSDQASYLLHEQIGTVKYFAAYTAFYNGCNVQIGYIAMPAFISQEEMDAEVDGLLARFLPPYIVVLLLMFLLSYTAAHRLVKPIRMMTKQMQNFRLGKKNIHIDYAYHDEVGELVDHYNELVDRVEQATRRLASSEREGAWRTMARQIAHEINNPLTPMKLSIQQLQRLKGQPDFEERFDKATRMLVEQIDNLGRIASSFSTFAKVPEVRASKVDIAEKLCSVIALHANNSNNIPVRYVGPDNGVIVWADGEQIQQVFTNLLKNALQAVGAQEDGDIIVRLQETQGEVCISVSDNGPGISDEIKDKIFTPNFTTKTNGTGLGLAISKHIVEGCGGHILFETSKKGTNFLVYLKK